MMVAASAAVANDACSESSRLIDQEADGRRGKGGEQRRAYCQTSSDGEISVPRRHHRICGTSHSVIAVE